LGNLRYSQALDYGPETGLLEPWVQWPSLFYGFDSKRLGVRELG